MAERGLPTTIANKLRDGLEEKVRADLGEPIDVSIEQGSLLLDPDGEVHLGGSVPRNRKTDDVVIFLTEMPRLWGGKPTPAEIDLQRMAGIVQDMLFLSQADRGARARRTAVTSLAALAERVAGDHRLVAPHRHDDGGADQRQDQETGEDTEAEHHLTRGSRDTRSRALRRRSAWRAARPRKP